jgi:cellulose synthase/poly-beta-1,6-N-acetylglucosamine synthase-like glycosyltransferase
MFAVEIPLWILVFDLFYIYFGYPLLLSLVALFRRGHVEVSLTYELSVSLIIATYNEEAVIDQKIKNTLQLNYLDDKLEIIVFSDGSTDQTDEIVKGYADQGVKLLRVEGRKGKTYCQNEAVEIANGEVVVFSDANSMYEPDAIQKLVRHLADERVGCVSGELRYRGGGEAVEGERTYWQYDQTLKRLESKVSSLVTANGAIYAVRKNLYEPLPADVISDFVEPLKIVQNGYRVIYESEAVAWETTAEDPKKEFGRRVRIVTRSVHSLLRGKSLLSLLNPLRYGIFSVQLWSHKVLRWFSGIFLLLILALNIPLTGHSWIYAVTMAGQVAFYLLALWGFISEKVFKQQAPKLPHIAYYFCLSCYAMLKGVYYGLRGSTVVTWDPNR